MQSMYPQAGVLRGLGQQPKHGRRIRHQLHPTGRLLDARESQMNDASDATTVLVFSHRSQVREAIMNAVGRRPAPDLGRVRYVEASTIDEVLAEVDAGRVDLAILDG